LKNIKFSLSASRYIHRAYPANLNNSASVELKGYVVADWLKPAFMWGLLFFCFVAAACEGDLLHQKIFVGE